MEDIKKLYDLFLKSSGVSTDTRNITPNSIYFALKGDSFDGNNFANEALEKGASFTVIDKPEVKTSEKMILVHDVLTTLQQLAKYHREQLQTLIIAITGSNGKTTTKELINSVLSESFRVVATRGNLNNHIGVPLTLLSITAKTDIAIVEMGANHPKEIAFLCDIAQPDYGYITSFGKAHLEGFGSFEGVIKTKTELYDYLKNKEKTIIINYDDPIQVEATQSYKNRYGFSSQFCEASNVFVTLEEASPIQVRYNQKIINTHLVGTYNFSNVVAAITFGRFFKMSEEAIKRGVEKYVPKNNRSQLIKKGGNTLILDAYNANPSSMLAAIKNVLAMKSAQKVLILGDMFELGASTAEEHQNIADFIAQYPWKAVFFIGENFSRIETNYPTFKNLDEFKDKFSFKNYTQTLFLIKGSRAMALERILDIE
ncbi:UDP-N-acetylmuramoyl-tripeptide--D-alanyl-D-alanine ligase [Capnocytophaga canimorsus]|uniref:UDP-N-acetylmuramoyl-tripeptide--D-alanyl-D- alanine ligase n=1 Tax=Capnocytophaga canimorsus TaxID=28188 RepID=UPI0037D07B84